MPTPEIPRPPEVGMARALNKAGPGQQMGRMTGLSPIARGTTRARRVAPAASGMSGVVANTGPGSSPSAWTELQQTGTPFLDLSSYPTCLVTVSGIVSASVVMIGAALSAGEWFEGTISFDGLSFAASLYTPGNMGTDDGEWAAPRVTTSFNGIFFEAGDSFFPVGRHSVSGTSGALKKVELYASHSA